LKTLLREQYGVSLAGEVYEEGTAPQTASVCAVCVAFIARF